MPDLLISCEHASNHVPDELATLPGSNRKTLLSHRAFDAGALEAATRIAEATGGHLISGTCTRLAIDLNRGSSNPRRFSEYSRQLSPEKKAALEAAWYTPYRDSIAGYIKSSAANRHTVIHLSVHSFTPVLNGVVRNADIGLLYDPARIHERSFAERLKVRMHTLRPSLHIRYNYPYRGVTDGCTTWMRKHYAPARYIGIEIELNQRLLKRKKAWEACLHDLAESVRSVVSRTSAERR
jgi:predicted N-formylglutamate amidohydrolase